MKVFIKISGTTVIRKSKAVWKCWSHLLLFSFELERFGVAVHKIHQNTKKMVAFVRNCLVKMTVLSISVVMTMVPMLLRKD